MSSPLLFIQFPRCLVLVPLPLLLPPTRPSIHHVAGSELPSQVPVCLQPAEGSEDPSASAQRRGEARVQRRPHAPPAGYAPIHAGDDCHEPLPPGLQGGGSGRHLRSSHAGLIGAGEEAELVSRAEEDGAPTHQW